MWLSELEKGMTVWYSGVDHKVYQATVLGWSSTHVFVRRLYRSDTETILIEHASTVPL